MVLPSRRRTCCKFKPSWESLETRTLLSAPNTWTFGETADTFTSSKDTMIFQNNPNNSLGGGIVMYAGTNSAQSIRRGLVDFDIADHIPQGAIIASAQLTLTYAAASGGGGGGGGGGGNTGSPNSFNIGLYRLLANWGEGIVGTGTGTSGVGQGQPANPGDATWSDAFSNTSPWSNPGGDFVSTAAPSHRSGD